MTTLIMVQTPDDVILGWDGLMTNGNESTMLVEPKFFVNNGIVYGLAGTKRASDLLAYEDLPAYDPIGYPDRKKWIVREWIPVFRDLLAAEPALVDEDGRLAGCSIVMVVGGQAFELDNLLNAAQSIEGIYTVGSGGSFARGALFAGATVMEALHVAADIDPYTGGAFTVASAREYIRANS